MRTRLAMLVLVAALGGCATTDSSQPVTAPPPSVVPTSDSAAPSFAPGTPSASLTSVRGTVSDGVEPGCVLLTAADKPTYLLLGGDKAALTAGRTVTVWGTPQPGMMSTCMQGTPFQVSRVEN
jgi:hypothetical protein